MSAFWKGILSISAIGYSIGAMAEPGETIGASLGIPVELMGLSALLGFVMSCVAVRKLWKVGAA